MTLSPGGSRLFVASGSTDKISVVDTRSLSVISTFSNASPAATGEGSTPNAIAVSPDGGRLFVAEADNNAVAIFTLSAGTSGVSNVKPADSLIGRIPVGWYPSAVEWMEMIYGCKRKGTWHHCQSRALATGTAHAASHPRLHARPNQRNALDHPCSECKPDGAQGVLQSGCYGQRLECKRHTKAYPPFEHVIYIIKENRTYDQVLGDMTKANGDTSLCSFRARSRRTITRSPSGSASSIDFS